MSRFRLARRCSAAAALAAASASAAAASDCLVITGASVADGSGKPLRRANVRVCGDEIRAVGVFRPRREDRLVSGRGLVVAPGFIDIHNHSTGGLSRERFAASQVSQGITTLAIGADGESPWPLSPWIAERRAAPAAVNVLAFVGHATLREAVMGADYKRASTPEETAKMAQLVDEAMRQGAVGLSSGLEYEVGSWSTTDELVAMSRAAARHRGIYMSHIRDEADKSFEAFTEALEIGRRAGIPVQISHIKLGTAGVWGKTAEGVPARRRPGHAAATSPRTAIPTRRGTRTSRCSSRTRNTTTRRASSAPWRTSAGPTGSRSRARARTRSTSATTSRRSRRRRA